MSNPDFSRRKFMQQSLALGSTAFLGGQLISCQKHPESNPAPLPPPAVGVLSPAECMPMLYWTGQREASLSWPVKSLSRGWVEYGETPALGKKALAGDDVTDYVEGFSDTIVQNLFKPQPEIPKDADAFVLRARLKNLTPGKPIYYRVHTQPLDSDAENGSQRYGDVRQFTLPDSQAPEARLAFWNDTHDNAATLQGLHDLTRSQPTDLLVWNGDVSNDVQRESQLVPLYLAPAKGLDVTALCPMVFSRGNHDVRGAMAARLGHYSAMRRSYYSFRIGPLAAIVLDTGEDKPDNHPTFRGRPAFEPMIKKQAAWLAEEIQRPGIADAPYRILICHIPLRWRDESRPDYAGSGYDHFSERGRAAWHDSLVKWKTQLIVSGHNHENHFIPSNPDFPYAQILGGGPLPNNATLMRLNADANAMTITSLNLRGVQLRQDSFKPLTFPTAKG